MTDVLKRPAANGSAGQVSAERVRGLLEPLLGRMVKVQPLNGPVGLAVSGIYRTDDGRIAGTCGFDLPLAASVSAALGLFPVSMVRQALATRSLDGPLMDDFGEVLNICARLINDVSSAHVALAEIVRSPAAGRKPEGRALTNSGFHVSVAGYGEGALSIAIVAL
jgi:hypothetical protein